MAADKGDDAALSALAAGILAHEDDAIVVLRVLRDEDGDVVDFVHEVVNEAAERNAGQRLQGRRQLEVYPIERGSLYEQFRQLVLTRTVMHTEIEVGGSDPATIGRTYHVYARPVDDQWVVCQYRDITELRAAQQALKEQALHDPLTGLPNRRLLLDHIEQSLARLPRHRSVVALLFCDLDGFKEVNDTFGHPAGDNLLQQVARRLQAAVRPEDTVARIGGDEFVVLSDGLDNDSDALAMASRIRDAVAGRYSLHGTEVPIGMSVGLATTQQPESIERLLSRADAALYTAKRQESEPPIALA